MGHQSTSGNGNHRFPPTSQVNSRKQIPGGSGETVGAKKGGRISAKGRRLHGSAVRRACSVGVEVRGRLVDVLRRDIIGPGPQDVDIAHERLMCLP